MYCSYARPARPGPIRTRLCGPCIAAIAGSIADLRFKKPHYYSNLIIMQKYLVTPLILRNNNEIDIVNIYSVVSFIFRTLNPNIETNLAAETTVSLKRRQLEVPGICINIFR